MKKLFAKKSFIITFIIVFVLAGAGVGAWFYVDSLAYKVCRVEAGVEVKPSDFLKKGNPDAAFTEDGGNFAVDVPGEYHVEVKSGLFTHKCTLYIQDTISPEAKLTPVELEMGQTCEAEAFVEQITDATAVTISYGKEPDFGQPGTQEVEICLTDAGNNQTRLAAELFVSQVVEHMTLEAGSEPPVLEDFVIASQTAAFLTDMEALDYHTVGEYNVDLKVDGRKYQSVLQLVDTVPPTGQTQDIDGFAKVSREASDFVTEMVDETAVEVTFEKEPDFAKIGTQEVTVLLTDAGQNSTALTARLTLQEDTEPPVIEGASDMTVYIGNSISYKKHITVTDNCQEDLNLSVDSSAVNMKEAGVYPVTYTATDGAGNTTAVTINLTVKAPDHTEEEIYALADAVLASILTPEMTPLDKVQAIYDYNKSHIAYINHTEKVSWLLAAYMGLAEGKGDCYVYASVAKALLTRAGITNMDIAKIPARTSHYWNLVDIGDGWYHFDSTPRRDRPTIFMWTEERLMEYSANHNKSHNYDHDLYPVVN